jgi:hypothetical protein
MTRSLSRRRATTRMAGSVAALLTVLATLFSVSGCSAFQRSIPSCAGLQRLALVAQSVPTASFVPCIDQLPPGWSVPVFRVGRGQTAFSLLSDRAGGRSVAVRFDQTCQSTGSVPTTSRAPGVHTSVRIESIDPRYSGTLYDTFPGGCVAYEFDFKRGPHISLMEEFENTVHLVSRNSLRLQLHTKLGLQLDQ